MLLSIFLSAAAPCGYDWLIDMSYKNGSTIQAASVLKAPEDCELVIPDSFGNLSKAQVFAYAEYINLSAAEKRNYSAKDFAASLWRNGWQKVPIKIGKYVTQPLNGGTVQEGEAVYTASLNTYGNWEANNANPPNSIYAYMPLEFNAYYDPDTDKIVADPNAIVTLYSVEVFNATEYFDL